MDLCVVVAVVSVSSVGRSNETVYAGVDVGFEFRRESIVAPPPPTVVKLNESNQLHIGNRRRTADDPLAEAAPPWPRKPSMIEYR